MPWKKGILAIQHVCEVHAADAGNVNFEQALTVRRLLMWYAIITIAFRCPDNLESCAESSPAICTPYLHAKHVVAPHITAYYEAYAEPYVELARPYYMTSKEQVLVPTYNFAARYAAPRIEQARQIGWHQWERNLQPRLNLYQNLSHVWYQDTVAPHVQQAFQVVEPYLEMSKESALQMYHEVILPVYDRVCPYALSGYRACVDFTTSTANWAWTNVFVFLDGTVCPHARRLYTQHVEPQLVRIGERLGRHKQERAAHTGAR
jgi:hypothetical protein